MDYDPTRAALYFPETQYPDFSKVPEWTLDGLCAEFSRKAYFGFDRSTAEKDRLKSELAGLGFTEPACFANMRGAQAFATHSNKHGAIVAFRGTQVTEPFDGLVDILTGLRTWDGAGRVHKGFWFQLETMLHGPDGILAWLATQPAGPISFTGHSLGAALATLLAQLPEGRCKDAQLVTFGSPFVGDTTFIDGLAQRSRRYVDCLDVVTTVPFWRPFAQVGEMIYIDSAGKTHSPPPPLDLVEADRRKAFKTYRQEFSDIPGKVLVRNLADHAPINYVSAVLKIRTLTAPRA